MRVGNSLAERRGDRTQSAIVEETGISQAYISLLEKGWMIPRDEWIAQLEAAYGAPVDELWESWAASVDGRALLTVYRDEEH